MWKMKIDPTLHVILYLSFKNALVCVICHPFAFDFCLFALKFYTIHAAISNLEGLDTIV